MKSIIIRLLTVALSSGFTVAALSQDLNGAWTLRIDDLKHKELSLLTIRFTEKVAPSCIGGNWKRVVVDRSKTTDKVFFPISEPLSYEIVGSEITIGRNEVCDGYLHLRGKLDGEKAQGTYSGFGMGGGNELGYFQLSRNR